MSKYLSILFLCCLPAWLWAGENYRFRVYLKDKGDDGYRVEEPEAYLSKQAIERRAKNDIAVTDADFPISRSYIDMLSETGVIPVVQSKWFATVVVESPDSTVAEQLQQLAIVDSVKWIWKGNLRVPAEEKGEDRFVPEDEPLCNEYGYAHKQIKMLNGTKLHEAGFQGEGMRVAVIDAGFMNADRISAFDSLRLLGTHNVVFPGKSVFVGDDHGTKVLSCLAADIPGVMVGTAPKASYLLLKSEDSDSEYPIEEDYWTAAVEYADSAGVDVISSSLGYFAFDADELSYEQAALDGKTAMISQAAHLAADKGILVFCSAGNEGNGDWEKITFPSDAAGIFTVGAIDEDKKKSGFSSIGFTIDGRVKPDAVALGTSSCVIGPNGSVRYANGTSFATPILAGMGVCLWQSLPWLNNREMIELLHRSSSQYKHPDTELGYGIPDFYKAYKKERKNGKRAK
ncbi:S8 family peptidase [Parabacteroides johnsonii]|uniref:S8 family peptidase n=1 Tax=Parabacteroides johnsonii TaxID=387661 RepID=UPI001C8CB633|nr:S8 family serine peptidase [Parabacteroides johnsonii]MBX9111799.1 S8 family serine peptidase [Parabacteroides johnsonii]